MHIELWHRLESDVDLATVVVGFAVVVVCHQSSMRVWQPLLFIVETAAVYACTAIAGLTVNITAMNVLAWLNTMENVVFVVAAPALLSRAEGPEVLDRLRHNVLEKLKDDTTSFLVFLLVRWITDANIEEALWVKNVESWQFLVNGVALGGRLLFINTLRKHIFHRF